MTTVTHHIIARLRANRRLLAAIFIMMALFAAMPGLISADTVVLKNGREVEGLIREVPSRNQIEIMVPGSKITFNMDEVTTFSLDQESINFLISGKMAVIENQPATAWQYFIYAMDDGVPLERLKGTLLAHRDQIFPKDKTNGIEKPTLLKEFCDKLRRYGQTEDDLLALCARTLFVLNEYQGALETYNMISNYYYAAHPEDKAYVVTLIQREIGEDIAMGRIPLALQKAEVFAAIEPSVAESCLLLAYLNWAGEEKREGNYENSLRICRDDIHPIAPTIARDRVVKILNLLKARSFETGDYADGIRLASEYAKPVAPEDYEEFVLEVIERAIAESLETKEWQLAQGYIDLAPEDLRDKALRHAMDQIEYGKRQAALQSDDYNGYFKLGEWAMSRGLLDNAVEAYTQAAKSEPLKQDSLIQVELINQQRQTEAFKVILQVYESADYMETLRLSDEYTNNFPNGVYAQELAQLVSLTHQRLATEEGKRPLKAEIAFQQAERAYILGEFGECMAHLNDIERLYSDTPAYNKAQNLKAKTERAIEMSRLESLTRHSKVTEVPLDQLPAPQPRSEISKIHDEMQTILEKLNSYNKKEN